MSRVGAGTPFLLVLAGHDPTGGAGVDADREAAAAQGVVARCVVTAWTDQDGRRVHAVRPRPPAEWAREARALSAPRSGDRGPDAVKTGLLAGAEAVHAAADLLEELAAAKRSTATREGTPPAAGRPADPGPALPWVVDPVLAASGGEPFLDEAGTRALRERLLPRGEVILTPNLPELARLAGVSLEVLEREPAARLDAAHALLAGGLRAVVVKGGHGTEDPVLDLLLERGAEPRWLRHPRVPGPGLHGSGCRFASALAAGLARGRDLPGAVGEAGRYLAGRLEAAVRAGAAETGARREASSGPPE